VSVKTIPSPLQQARGYAHQLTQALEKYPSLRDGRGKLKVMWSYGVVLTNISRAQFEEKRIGEIISPDRVICQDEMRESSDPKDLRNRLASMFPFTSKAALTSTEIDSVRHAIFPELRISSSIGSQSFLQQRTDVEWVRWVTMKQRFRVMSSR
jgi:hypothetical protein